MDQRKSLEFGIELLHLIGHIKTLQIKYDSIYNVLENKDPVLHLRITQEYNRLIDANRADHEELENRIKKLKLALEDLQ